MEMPKCLGIHEVAGCGVVVRHAWRALLVTRMVRFVHEELALAGKQWFSGRNVMFQVTDIVIHEGN